MCVAGVAGCMAIVISAFGMGDSMNAFFNMLFSKMHNYDLQVVFKPDITTAQYNRIAAFSGITESEFQMYTSAAFFTNGKEGKKENAGVTVVEDEISLMLIDTEASSPVKMPDGGIIMAKSLAVQLGINEGETLRSEITGINKPYYMKVSRICKNIQGVYISRSMWRDFGLEYLPSAVYIRAEKPSALKKSLSGYEFIMAVKEKAEVVAAMESQLSNMYVMLGVLSLAGGVLAFVVLYNLGIMNYFERMRELATLMVLGFYNKEIKVLVLRENTIFTIAGIIIGIPFGVWLNEYLMSGSEAAGYEPDIYIKPLSFLISAGLTYIYVIIVNLMLGHKFKKIDMIGALKSVE
jgi:ABC-type antimicrobial peptide transport system permease subunit